jgi:hypothetical protein
MPKEIKKRRCALDVQHEIIKNYFFHSHTSTHTATQAREVFSCMYAMYVIQLPGTFSHSLAMPVPFFVAARRVLTRSEQQIAAINSTEFGTFDNGHLRFEERKIQIYLSR